MTDATKPDTATLRRLSVKFGLDPRTIAKAIRGEPIKGAVAQEAAAKAVAEWKKIQKRKARTT